MPKSFLNNFNYSRGIRNNNPGNLVITDIKWDGKIPVLLNNDGKFEQFYELRYGIRALMRDIFNDHKKGKTSVIDLISEYAPAFENHTNSYIANVVKSIGMAIIPQLDESTLINVAKAIIAVENGSDSKYVTDQDYKDAIAILGLPLPKKKI